MKVSASLIVTCFCAALIINPIVLLLLFSRATDDAISGIVSIWDASGLAAVHVAATLRGEAILDTMDLAAEDIAKCWSESSDATACVSAVLGTFSDIIITVLSASASLDASSFPGLRLITADQLPGTDIFNVAALPLSTAPVNDGSCSADDLCISSEDISKASFVFRNASDRAIVLGATSFSWCEDAAEMIQDELVLNGATNDAKKPAIAGAMIGLAALALHRIGANRWLILVIVPPPRLSNFQQFSCPLIQASLNNSQTYYFQFGTFLDQMHVHVGTSASTEEVSLQNNDWWLLPFVVGDGAATSAPVLSLVLPRPYAILLIFSAPSSRSVRILSCSSSDQYALPSSTVGEESVCGQVIGNIASGEGTGIFSNVHHGVSIFFEFASWFLTLRRMLVHPLVNATASVEQQSITGGLSMAVAVRSEASRDLLSSATSSSVIVSVSVTALVFVVTLAVLHYMFHPLKVAGSLLRCCADIRLHDLELQSPSFIKEFYQLQRSVDILIRRIRIIGKHMPDKTQLYSVLNQSAELQDFNDASVTGRIMGRITLRNDKHQSRMIGGGVAHSVSIRLEYRSRLKGKQARAAGDHRKQCAFEFVYTAQDNIYDALMQQVLERLNERVGEELRMFDKKVESRNVTTASSSPLTTDEDVLDAIEACHERTLHLMVIKVSEKNYALWLQAVLSIVDLCMIFNAAIYFMSAGDDDLVAVRRAGLTMAVIAAMRLAGNVIAAMYLVRVFSMISTRFASWVPAALQEILVIVLLSGASLANLSLMFSHTRLTSSLRFNAPYSEQLFRPRLFRWCSWSIVLGDVLPLGLCAFALAQLRVFHVNSLLGIVFPALSTCTFALENYFDDIVLRCGFRSQHIDGMRRSGAASGSYIESDGQEMLLHQNGSSPRDASCDGDDDDDSSFACPNVAFQTPKQNRSLYLGLSRRPATVVRVGLHRSSAHFEEMDALEIQRLCSAFLGAVFSEAKTSGGIVLTVSNADVTIGFNCHQAHLNHFSRALSCFFAILHAVRRCVPRWSEDDPDPPRLVGAIVTGFNFVIGFAGCGDARTFQLLGRAKRELEVVTRAGSWYGATLSCNDAASKLLVGGADSKVYWRSSFTPSALGTSEKLSMVSHETGADQFLLSTRLIEVVSEGRYAEDYNKKFGSAGSKGQMQIHEILFEADCEEMANSSRIAFAFLENGTQGAAQSTRGDPMTTVELIRGHLALFPCDSVAKAILRRSISSTTPRELSSLGIDMIQSEAHSIRRVNDHTAPSAPVAHSPSSIFQRICAAEKYKLFFTDL